MAATRVLVYGILMMLLQQIHAGCFSQTGFDCAGSCVGGHCAGGAPSCPCNYLGEKLDIMRKNAHLIAPHEIIYNLGVLEEIEVFLKDLLEKKNQAAKVEEVIEEGQVDIGPSCKNSKGRIIYCRDYDYGCCFYGDDMWCCTLGRSCGFPGRMCPVGIDDDSNIAQ